MIHGLDPYFLASVIFSLCTFKADIYLEHIGTADC